MEIEKIARELNHYKKQTPRPKRMFDQFTADLTTTVNRAKLLSENGDLYRKRVIFLGDDDLTSVACAMIEPSAQITVLEIDRRIVNLIKQAAQEKHLNIKVEEMDLIKELPNSIKGKYEVVFTDPPYAGSGVALFLNRAIDLLMKIPDVGLYICHGYSDKSRERGLNIQTIINERGLLIKNAFYGFNHYFEAKSVGSKSTLYQLSFTARTRIVKLADKRIYSHE